MSPSSLTLTAAPVIEPVSVEEVRAAAGLGGASEDARLLALIIAARQRLEEATGRAFIAQSWRETRDSWSGDDRLIAFATQFRLARPPLISIDQIRIYDGEGTPDIWPSSQYYVHTGSDPGRIALRPNSAFPKPGRRTAGIEIDFTAGFGAAPGDVPAPIREAIALYAAELFTRPDAAPSKTVTSLIAPWRRWRL